MTLSFVQIKEKIVDIPKKSRPTCSRVQVRHAELVLVPVPRSAQDRVYDMIQQPYPPVALPYLRFLCLCRHPCSNVPLWYRSTSSTLLWLNVAHQRPQLRTRHLLPLSNTSPVQSPIRHLYGTYSRGRVCCSPVTYAAPAPEVVYVTQVIYDVRGTIIFFVIAQATICYLVVATLPIVSVCGCCVQCFPFFVVVFGKPSWL